MNHPIQLQAQAVVTAAATEGESPKLTSQAYNGGLMKRIAKYDAPVIVDLDGLTGLGTPHPVYRNHDDSRILGAATTEREGNSLVTNGEFTNETEDVAEVVRLGKKGHPWQASIGVDPSKVEKLKAGQTAVVNGNEIKGPAYVIRAGELTEVSVVSRGADSTTSTRIAATFTQELSMDLNEFISASGFDPNTLEDKQLNVLRAAYDAQQKRDNLSPAVNVDAVIQAAKAKEKRYEEYGRIVASAIDRGMDTDTAEKLVEAARRDDMSATEFELQVLRASRPTTSTYIPTKGNDSPQIIEAALARAVGGDVEEMGFSPEVLQASEDRFRHGLSLGEVLQMSARRNGYDGYGRDVRPLLQAAFAPVHAAGPSSYDLVGVLSNLANRFLRVGYLSVDQEWRKIASIRSVSDFKTVTSYTLTGDFVYQKVGNGGEIKHATMGEQTYTNKADTYARLISITRNDIINDDLQAFDRVRQMLGRGAALSFNQLFWSKFLSTVTTFWHTDNSNVISGASSALDLDSLSNAMTTFESLTDPNGNAMGLTASLLVVPTALKITGSKLVNDTEMRINGASSRTSYTTSNPFAGSLQLVSTSYLNNAKIPNGSATHWWVMADPMDMPTIEAVFLNNRQLPTIESADADFNVLGVNLRGYHDAGVELVEPRASVRSVGA